MKRCIFLFIAVVSMVGMLAISGCNKEKLETYTVNFDANGGKGTMEEQKFKEGESKALSTNQYTRDKYNFKEWNTVIDGSGKSFTDGQIISISSDMTLYAQWEEIINPNQLNGHVYVDLGLPSGLLWAECNIDSKIPQAWGKSYAWGETEEDMDGYTFRFYDYAWTDSYVNPELTKYCNDPLYGSDGFTDDLTTLEASDDVATKLWGAGWRMPTKDEMQELIDNCTITWTIQNTMPGREFKGPNGNTIFMAAAGYCEGTGSDCRTQERVKGCYWTSSLYTDTPKNAWHLDFDENSCAIWKSERCYGYSVRAVCSLQN